MPRTTKVCSALTLAFGGSLLIAAGPAVAQQQQLERVQITGSSIKRIEGQSALPVQVITREDISKSGAVNMEQLMQSVSAAASSGALSNASASGATTGGISSVSLRGLTSRRTLVLMNGRRIAPYGIGFTGDAVSVDINSIPLAAIERIEVLKDGASAIYGSDAIAGVVNFITRRDYSGAELGATYGDTTQGGATLKRLNGTVGFGDLAKDRFNVMLGASYQKEGALFGRDRAFASSVINVDALNDTSSGNTFPANVVLLDGTGRTVNPSAPTCPPPYAVLSPLRPATQCRFDPAPLVTLIPASERASLFASAKLAITNDLEAFVEASYNRNRQRVIVQPSPISDQFALPPNHPLFNVAPYNGFQTILLSPSSPFYPTSTIQPMVGAGPLPDLFVRSRANVNGNRDYTNISEAPRLVLGLSGAAKGWDFDGAYLHTQSKVREQVNSGYQVLSQILPLLNSGNVNFFGPNSAAVDAQLIATEFRGDAYTVTSTIDGVQGKATREMARLQGGPLALAVGAEYRLEKLHFDATPTMQTGDISGYSGNFQDTDRQRKVGAAFAELSVPIIPELEATAAVRWDKYQGVGNATSPKLGMRWQPARSMLFRGSVGKGFRAPSLQDLYLPVMTHRSNPGLSDPLRCPSDPNDCDRQFAITAGGTPTLKPERSLNSTLGMVLEPVDNVSIAIDYFKIKLKDTIENGIDQSTILGDLGQYGGRVTRGPVDPAFPALPGPITNIDQTNLNIGRVRLSGIDLDAKWRIRAAELGSFTLGLAGTYFIKWERQNLDGSYTNQVARHNEQDGGVIPRWKHHATVDWVRGPWNVIVAHRWQSGYRDILGTHTDEPRRVSSYSIFDAQTSFTGLKNLRMTLGVRNIFDTDPPYTNAGGQTSFQAGYEPLYADPRGRFVYVTLNYAFR